MVDAYLKWSEGNKKSPETDEQRSTALLTGFKGKLISDINPFVVEKYKMARAKIVTIDTIWRKFKSSCNIGFLILPPAFG